LFGNNLFRFMHVKIYLYLEKILKIEKKWEKLRFEKTIYKS